MRRDALNVDIRNMKGIILAAGKGTRLRPLTRVTSKQLLPVYNKPMIMYPLETLLRAGITDILFIVAPDHAGGFLHVLGSGKEYGAKFTYEIQDQPTGIADAYRIGADFIDDGNVAMILGDNIFEDDFSEAISSFTSGATIFVKEVPDPERFGVLGYDADGKPNRIEEKPKQFISNFAITGLYIFDNRAVEIASTLQPSARGEFEVTDIQNWYLQRGELSAHVVKGEWVDAGTFDSLLKANNLAAQKLQK